MKAITILVFFVLIGLLLYLINTLLDIHNFLILLKKDKKLHTDNELEEKYQFIKGLF